MKSIGLNINDDDVFEWTNSSKVGGYNHFIVETGTTPGYFTPELIEKGMTPKNLIFQFSIPHSIDPERVFDIMMNAALYAQKRLGGKLVNNYGELVNTVEVRQSISKIVKQLNEQGIKPGSEKAFAVF